MRWKCFLYDHHRHFYIEFTSTDLFDPARLNNSKYFEPLRRQFLEEKRSEYRWQKSSKKLTQAACNKILKRFWELVLTDLIMNHDRFVFPFKQYGFLGVGATKHPWFKNYINWKTDHKKIEVIFVSRKRGRQEIHFLYRIRLTGKWWQMLSHRIYEDRFHFDNY